MFSVTVEGLETESRTVPCVRDPAFGTDANHRLSWSNSSLAAEPQRPEIQQRDSPPGSTESASVMVAQLRVRAP